MCDYPECNGSCQANLVFHPAIAKIMDAVYNYPIHVTFCNNHESGYKQGGAGFRNKDLPGKSFSRVCSSVYHDTKASPRWKTGGTGGSMASLFVGIGRAWQEYWGKYKAAPQYKFQEN